MISCAENTLPEILTIELGGSTMGVCLNMSNYMEVLQVLGNKAFDVIGYSPVARGFIHCVAGSDCTMFNINDIECLHY